MPNKIPTLQPATKSIPNLPRQRNPYYDTARWKRLRRWQLSHYPVCNRCGRPATEVHHINGLTDSRNLESLCKSCHSKQTRKENKNGV